ncbi:MAG: hypothetical protein Q9218_005935 [Villophora microphyllina]
MHCDICQRPCGSKLPFNCALCARDNLYEARIRHAHTLLEHGVAHSQIDQLLKASCRRDLKESATHVSPSGNSSPLLTLESINSQQIALQERTTLILDHSNRVRADVDRLNEEVASRRSFNERRREEIVRTRQELARHRAIDVEQLQKTASRIQQRWDVLHLRTAESRLLLSKEAAILSGLQNQRAAKVHKTAGYAIGGLPIFNLKDLNRVEAAEINAVSARLAHLVHLISHYLALRLPAEIILPYPDHPQPTISPPAISYTAQQISFGRTIPAPASSRSPSASRALQKSQKLRPKPQPLYLKEKLSLLAKDDQQAYTEFVEGTTLLAWNIAWLCKSQGIDIGATSWEEVCDVGKNLQMLLAADRSGRIATSAAQDSSGKQPIPNKNQSSTAQDGQQQDTSSVSTQFGQYSHDTVHSNLLSATGSQHMHGWRLQDPRKIIARVKHMLQSDRTGAGWDLLEGKEWETESVTAEQTALPASVDASTVVVNPGSEPYDIHEESRLRVIRPPSDNDHENNRGTSGWTKLKSR